MEKLDALAGLATATGAAWIYGHMRCPEEMEAYAPVGYDLYVNDVLCGTTAVVKKGDVIALGRR